MRFLPLTHKAKEYGRAFQVYFQSNVDPLKIISKYLTIDRMDIVLNHLKGTLKQPEMLPVLERKQLSDILFKCFVQVLLEDPESFAVQRADFGTSY